MEIAFLRDLVAVYGFGVLVVYLFHRLKQSPVAGFLVAGVLVGPHGFSLVRETSTVEMLAEVGVMLLLFSLGLEFSLRKFTQMRYVVFGTGSVQVLATVVIVMAVTRLLGISPKTGVFFGFLLALSSTAIVLKILTDTGQLDSIHGRIALGVLIFQDFCIVPMIVIVPLLALGGSVLVPLVEALVRAAFIIVLVLVVARYLFPALLKQIVGTRSKELFVITCVFMFLGTAWFTSGAGLSLALGSFLAGLILSESEYSHQIFAEIRPLRDGLNSLFFISIGMLVDPAFVIANLKLLISVMGAIVVGKAALVTLVVMVSGFPLQIAVLAGLPLAQIGEFSFVLLRARVAERMVPERWYQVIIASAVSTMILTPAMFALARKLSSLPKISQWGILPRRQWLRELDRTAETVADHVIICGFGASGKNVARVLRENSIPYLILELNAQTVEKGRSEGEPIFFGDCTDAGILSHAGIGAARVLIFAISDPFSTRRAVPVARRLNPELTILVRTKYLAEIDQLYDLGATEVVAEEFEASIELLTRILRIYHVPRAMVASEIKQIREQRYGIFRGAKATVPRLRLSEELDIYTETFEVEEKSPVTGRRIVETGIRQESGILILGIIRKGKTINNPGPLEFIQAGDRLILSGTKDQLNRATAILRA